MLLCLPTFFQNQLFQGKLEHYQSDKQFGKSVSRRQKMPLAEKGLKNVCTPQSRLDREI